MAQPQPSKFRTDLSHGLHVEALVAMRLAQRCGGAILPNPPGLCGTHDFRIEKRVTKSYEVKSHPAHERTGNVFYEVQYRGGPSGLKTTASDWWVDVCPPGLVFISKPKQLLEWLRVTGGNLMAAGDNSASQGYLVSSQDLLKLAETDPESFYVLELEP